MRPVTELQRVAKPFEVVSPYSPSGDQPAAIAELTERLRAGEKDIVLLGATGTGKSATTAWLVEQVQRPTLILEPNKTLAAQMAAEFRELLPNNAVEYFVSYYDYYQPEAYVPQTDTFIEKDSSINDEVERLRHSATNSLLTRRDVVVVSSVSCIYGLGTPQEYVDRMTPLEVGQQIDRDDLLRRFVTMQYTRNDIDFTRGTFRVRGDTVEIVQAGTDGHTRINREDFPLPALGWVVVWEDLIAQLHQAAEKLPFARPDDPAFAEPALVIHAGGMPPAQSRDDTDFDTHDSGQAGLLFEVAVTGTADTAFECFRPGGPLALLPAPALPDGPRYTVVWSDAAEASRRRAELPADALGRELREALRAALGPRHWGRHAGHFGPLRVCTPAVAVPLPRVRRRQTTTSGQVWIGNAAQMLHPVAGQGLNLGLRDAFVLARELGDAAFDPRLPGPHARVARALEAHARARLTDRWLTIHRTLPPMLLNAMHVARPLRLPLARALVFGHR